MAITAVHHVALIVSDYERSKEFYVDKLGFQIVRENFREDRQDYKLDLALDGVELEIFAPAERDGNHSLHPQRPSFPEAYAWMSFLEENLHFSRIRTDFPWNFMNKRNRKW